mmetsp:Transcript_30948/g.46958  ORF Transcript_30948/g.46958 Transcript_30948/m.46958 type:complete len:270 (-) Transcript_30948:50-859(-)
MWNYHFTIILLLLLSGTLNCSSHDDEQEQTCHYGTCINDDAHNDNDMEVDFEDEWYGIQKWWVELDCPKLFERERPIHSENDWIYARNIYSKDFQQQQQSSKDFNDSNGSKYLNGFHVPVQVKHLPGKGRGLFATTFIKKGTLIWTNTYTARFSTGPSYKKFIWSLSNEFACDTLQWAYVQSMSYADDTNETMTDLQISVDLDECAYCNYGNIDSGKGNMGCNDDDDTCYDNDGRYENYAMKDIQAGEELLCPYELFHVYDGYASFELG